MGSAPTITTSRGACVERISGRRPSPAPRDSRNGHSKQAGMLGPGLVTRRLSKTLWARPLLLNRIENALMNNPVRAVLQRLFEARRLLRMGGAMTGGRALEVGSGCGVGTELILQLFGADTVDASISIRAWWSRHENGFLVMVQGPVYGSATFAPSTPRMRPTMPYSTSASFNFEPALEERFESGFGQHEPRCYHHCFGREFQGDSAVRAGRDNIAGLEVAYLRRHGQRRRGPKYHCLQRNLCTPVRARRNGRCCRSIKPDRGSPGIMGDDPGYLSWRRAGEGW
jgi:hypothetical protein